MEPVPISISFSMDDRRKTDMPNFDKQSLHLC